MSDYDQDPAPDPDAELVAYGRRLADGARTLRRDPYERLCGALGRAQKVLSSAGPRLAQDALWLGQRTGYLTDAAAAVEDGILRVEVAVAAPAESDVSVHVAALRDHIGYFADMAGDVVPAAVYLDVGRDLLPALDERYGAPGLTLQVMPLVEGALGWMRAACGHAMVLTARAEALLAIPSPGGPWDRRGADPVVRTGLEAVHRAEIDRLIAALGASRPALSARPREDDGTRTRAIREYFDLTPRQLSALLASLGDGRAAEENGEG